MGERTGIEWAEATWNPWHGCTKISPGCKFCYMFREKKQYGQNPETVVRSKTTFNAPLKWKEPKTIFTCSWSDFFHEAADVWRAEAWNIIRQTPQHTYLVLTKRIDRVAKESQFSGGYGSGKPLVDITFPNNVILGVSVESARYKKRIELLRQVPAKRRFISFEPLIGPIANWRPFNPDGIHWAIVGAESGSIADARPMELEWARDIRDKCLRAGIPFFMKQICVNGKPITFEDFPEDLRIREMPVGLVAA
jgi:protein gp37